MNVFIHYPHGRRSIPLRHFVPNLITTTSLCCGLASIHYTLLSDWDHAVFAVLLAAVFDALDGRAARLLKATSPFGAVLDSLADFLSFGVAPGLLLHQWLLKEQDVFGLAAVMSFVLCSALRLARFTAAVKPSKPTVEVKGADGKTATAASPEVTPEEAREAVISAKFFRGMPTPAAAAAVLIPPMLLQSKTAGAWMKRVDVMAQPGYAFAVVLLTFLIAFLMISRLPMFSFKKVRIHRRWVVPLLALMGLIVVLAVRDLWLAAATLAALYLASLPLSIVSYRRIPLRPAGGTGTAEQGAPTAL